MDLERAIPVGTVIGEIEIAIAQAVRSDGAPVSF